MLSPPTPNEIPFCSATMQCAPSFYFTPGPEKPQSIPEVPACSMQLKLHMYGKSP